ncbi:uncharacterized protein N7459_004150 [Penicillium hispanicum]|uniref:uncharacterized protein n=1 Tax=Penicillium hispanicum TaxID=1080232 RepID=UPI002540FE73|nr:uncharacterized protein N7459_004150 [Penicillium hispanicum]KAJ5584350.1 hypothetical protein N7459_004150 [Penicillium hispanicum]
MATAATNGRPPALRSRNRAILSVTAVITGGWLLFRAQSPSKDQVLYSEQEKKMMAGGQAGDAQVGRAPISTKNAK